MGMELIPAGNRIAYTWNGATTNTTHDIASNRLNARLRPNEPFQAFQYDAQGNITNASDVTYAYDDFNRLISAERSKRSPGVHAARPHRGLVGWDVIPTSS